MIVEEGSCLPCSCLSQAKAKNDYNTNFKNGDQEVSATVNNLIQNYHTIWQKSFYDHIIRDQKDYTKIQEYIYNNPLKWELDLLNPKNDQEYSNWLRKNQLPIVRN